MSRCLGSVRCSGPTQGTEGSSHDHTRAVCACRWLPAGWEAASSESGERYYINTVTGESTYDVPTQPEAEPAPPPSLPAAAEETPARQPRKKKGGGGFACCSGKQAGRKGRPQERPSEPRALEPPQADAEPDGGSAEAAPSVEAPAAEAQEQHEAEQVEQVEQEAEQVEQEEGQVPGFADKVAEGLPEGWEAAVSSTTGDIYYVHTESGRSQYEHPKTAVDEHRFHSGGLMRATDRMIRYMGRVRDVVDLSEMRGA